MKRIKEKLVLATDSLSIVEDNLSDDVSSFMDKPRVVRDGVYKNVEHTIQALLDVCGMIAKEESLRIPDSDDTLIDELREADIIMERTATVLKDIKSFRNILVHQYGTLDEQRAYQNISSGVQDIHDAISDLGTYVD